VKLLAFSDLHCDLSQAAELAERSSEADVVIAAGDFAKVHDGLEETIDALKPISLPTVVIPGNNETEDALRAACEGWDSATVLHGQGTEIDGTQFYGLGAGVPITPWNWSFDLDDEAASAKLATALREGLPDEADLLGPAPMFRVRGRHRRRLLIKSDEREATIAAVRGAVEELTSDRSAARDIAVGVDVDPQ